MKSLVFLLAATLFLGSAYSQTVPPKTLVKMIATRDFNAKILKDNGGNGMFQIDEDVIVDGQKVISKGTPIEVKFVKASKSDFKVEMTEVKGTQGASVKLHDCWMYTTAEQNTGKPRGPLFRAGTRKICYTP